ncbi:MAG: CapA family protein [Ilumatobacter sp.]|uniref:CapA family protein n=1 Tax=Ilumatobacter sp. TaxID=1967498 RepID=UPI003C76F527
MITRPGRAFAALLAGVVVWSSACAFNQQFDDEEFTEVDVSIRILDEQGDPVANADVTIGEETTTSDDDGLAVVSIGAPAVATIETDLTLPEPVAIAPRDGSIDVRLWNRTGADGNERTSLHLGGDVMLGRRYLDPELSTPFVDDAESARQVVADLGPLMSAADWTSVNLETVVGDLPAEDALPAKRFLLQSTPLVTEALDEMGVDLVTLGNNHAYDWGEAGIVNTLAVLDDQSIPHVGAGESADDAVRGRLAQVGDLAVGVVSVTTVTGDFVNDQLPEADEPVPDDVEPDERWQYAPRPFGFSSADGQLTITERPMRIGEVWDIVDETESSDDYDDFEDGDALWAAATATFPELQDWVARRGHGGAARYQRDDVDNEIARLRSDGADFIVVQVHGGFQFAEANSSFLRTVARRSIDSGADAVVAHHPHVLQGVEWYDGKLIVYSLGNLVFDQGFHSTFPSAVLRIVTEGDEVLEARLLPIIIDRYRPVPVVGEAAQEIVRMVDARTAQPATSARIERLQVGSVLDDRADAGRSDDAGLALGEFDRSAAVVFERNSGLITRSRSTKTVTVDTTDPFGTELPACAIVRTDDLGPDTFVGSDLFDWGDFDRSTAQLQPRRFPVNWLVSKDSRRWAYDVGATESDFDRAFTLFSDTDTTTTVRIGARLDVDAHRLFDSDGRPVDAPASYEITLDAKRMRGETPTVRLVSFEFDDTDPTVDPESNRLHEAELAISVPDDGNWHRVALPIPDALFAPGENGAIPNAATMLIDTPPALRGEFTIDNVMFVEWRGSTTSDIATWVEGDVVRSSGDTVELTTSGC